MQRFSENPDSALGKAACSFLWSAGVHERRSKNNAPAAFSCFVHYKTDPRTAQGRHDAGLSDGTALVTLNWAGPSTRQEHTNSSRPMTTEHYPCCLSGALPIHRQEKATWGSPKGWAFSNCSDAVTRGRQRLCRRRRCARGSRHYNRQKSRRIFSNFQTLILPPVFDHRRPCFRLGPPCYLEFGANKEVPVLQRISGVLTSPKARQCYVPLFLPLLFLNLGRDRCAPDCVRHQPSLAAQATARQAGS